MLCSGCKTTFDLFVEGRDKDDFAALYLIVDDEDPLGGGEVRERDAVKPQSVDDYLFIEELQPDPDARGLSWRTEMRETTQSAQTIARERGERPGTLVLKVRKSLLEENPELHVLLVVQDARGSYQSMIFQPSVIKAADGKRVTIEERDGALELRLRSLQ